MYLRQRTIQGGVNIGLPRQSTFWFPACLCHFANVQPVECAGNLAGRVKRDRFNACHEWYGLGNSRDDTLETLQPQHGELPK